MSDESPHNLPGIITSIAVQKRNKERYSVFVDEKFLIGVDEQTLIKFNLRKGAQVTPSLFHKIQREEGRFAIKAYLLKRLGQRSHARKELLEKALRKDYSRPMIIDVLDELEEQGYIDDGEFARQFATDKKRLNNWGPRKIEAHLLKKGIGRRVARKQAEDVFKNENLEETFLHLISKRKHHFQKELHPLKRKKKVIGYLARKGYRSSSIYSCIDTLMKSLDA